MATWKEWTAYLMKRPTVIRRMLHPYSGPYSLMQLLSRTKYDFKSDVGDGARSSSIMAPIQWVQRTFPEAPLTVRRRDSNEALFSHEMIKLVDEPNPYYGGSALWAATLFSWFVDGNAYWIKIRNRAGNVVQLWYAPHFMMKPMRETTAANEVFVTHYEYSPGGKNRELRVQDVVHLRHGLNAENPTLGVAPLASVMREVWSDDEASNWVAALLRNSGLPGMLISPDPSGSNMSVLPMDVDAVKQYVDDMFTGDNRGKPMVLSGPTKVSEFGYAPDKMNLETVRNTAEERVCALIGIPAAVVGFGTGLSATKVGATMREYSKIAWTDGLIPLQRVLAAELRRQLLPEFEAVPERFQVHFDHQDVLALQDTETDRYTRANIGVTGGWITVSQAKQIVGLTPEVTDNVYLRSSKTMAVKPGEELDITNAIIRQALPAPTESTTDEEDTTEDEDVQDVEEVAELDDLLAKDIEILQKQGWTIQTLIFPKNKWDSVEACKAWARKHKFKTAVDATSTSWRMRQREPGLFERLRTICINPSRTTAMGACRVKAVGGPLKQAELLESINLNGQAHKNGSSFNAGSS